MTRPRLFVPPGYAALALRTPTLPPAAHTNCYIVGTREAIVVDPGSPYPGEQELLVRHLYRLLGRGGSLHGVFLTHHHPDHVGGALALARAFDVSIIAHARTFAQLAQERRWRRSLPAFDLETIDEGAVFQVDEGSRQLRVIHTPGHAVGHLCLFESTGLARGTLLAGDMIPGAGTTLIDPYEGDMARYVASLRRLAALDVARVLPAHGPLRMPARPLIARLIAHREAREARIVSALALTPRPLEVITREVYADLSPVSLPLALRTCLAHLYALRRGGRARRSRGAWALA